jgi:hypothetical protein
LTEKCLGGCCKFEFDSTYPIHLNGIISESDFRESMEKINDAIPTSSPNIINAVVSLLCCVVTPFLCIFGGVSGSTSPGPLYMYFALLGVGVGVIGCCILSCIFTTKIQTRHYIRLQKTIADESKKYTNRSPTPCSWRLNMTRTTSGSDGKQNVTPGEHVGTFMY